MREVVIEKWASFEEWEKDGFFILKGEKSILRSPYGTPLFNESQVEEFEDYTIDSSCIY